jgi:hypothetical protein
MLPICRILLANPARDEGGAHRLGDVKDGLHDALELVNDLLTQPPHLLLAILAKRLWTRERVARKHTALEASKMAFMMPLSLSSTSSRLQLRRALFCAISSPDTATPPAFAAFAGPNSIPSLW